MEARPEGLRDWGDGWARIILIPYRDGIPFGAERSSAVDPGLPMQVELGVPSALSLQAEAFFTFDRNQGKLARAEGLIVP